MRYNCFSRIIAVVDNFFFGLPVVNYFDDYGFHLNTAISVKEPRVFSDFPNMPVNWMRDVKTGLATQIVSL